MRHDTLRRHCAGLLISCFVIVMPLAVRARMGDSNETHTRSSGFSIAQGTKVKRVPFPIVGVPVPTNTAVTTTILLQLFAVSPTIAGLKPTNGRVDFTSSCFGNTVDVHNMRVKVKDGNAIYTETMTPTNGCNFLQVSTAGRGGATTPMESNGSVMVSVQPRNPESSCTPDKNTMCLLNSRFRTEVDWRSDSGRGAAVSFPTADNTGTFYFFDPGNTELVVKVLDGCNVDGFNNFWVFAAGLTDVEVTLTVTDTETGQVRTYFNPLGQASPAIQDTEAFATCP